MMTNPEGVASLSPAQLQQRMSDSRPPLVIDVLTGDHYRKVHLSGARNACVFEVSFMDQVAAITADRNAPIVVYGAGAESRDVATAAEKLRRGGYRSVAVLEGGIDQWRRDGFALDGEEVDAPDDPETILQLVDGRYDVDGAQSRLEWCGRNPGTRHVGTLALAGGEFSVAGGQVTGFFDVDMTSMDNINLAGDPLQPVLIAHLKSEDFFLVDRYPRARFTVERAQPVDPPFTSVPNYRVSGSLACRGIQAPLAFPATLHQRADGTLLAEAHFDFDRTLWNVIYGSSRFFRHLGMHLVFDLISVQVTVTARREGDVR
jgi:rhodanese-related sulfurtransferase/polyisoprenoid-binding protein YceI